MGRHFTAASSERIHFASTGLNGFDFRYGTWACWLNINAYPTGVNYSNFASTNSGVGASFGPQIVPGGLLDIFDGTTDVTATGPAAGTTALIGTTKATGTQTPRSHMFIPSTGVFTHTNYSGTNVDSAAVTALTIGNEADSATGGLGSFDGEMWKMAFWNKLVMTDSEFERLAKREDWSFFQPTGLIDFAGVEETGDVTRTLGRYPLRQTARTGTTRGTLKLPPGISSTPIRRR